MSNWIEEIMMRLGYLGIALLMTLENLFPPLPSELVMPLAGFTVANGHLSFAGVVIAGTAGSVMGALPLYYLGRLVKRERLEEWADHYGRWMGLSRRDVRLAQRWFNKYGAATVFYCRLVPGIRSLISVPAGMAKMPLLSFLLYSTVGMAMWTTVLTGLGWLLAENYSRVSETMGPLPWVILGVLAAVVITLLVRRKIAGRFEKAEKQ